MSTTENTINLLYEELNVLESRISQLEGSNTQRGEHFKGIMEQIEEPKCCSPCGNGNGNGGDDGGGTGGTGTGGNGGGTGEDGDDGVEEPLWDIKYKVNGEWVYEVTGQVVDVSDSRNSQYRQLATELVVSDRVTEIGYLAFRYWSNLVSVDLGNTVRSISNYAFEACTGLKDIVFSNSLEVIGDNSFGECHSLEVLDFGENLQTIKPWALVNLYRLHTIVFRSDPPVTFGEKVFGNGSSGGTKPQYVYAPDHLVDEYSVSIDRNNCRQLSQYNG